MSTEHARLRWFLAIPGTPRFRGPESIVSGPIRELRSRLEADTSVESFYVSKHNGCEVWLTVFASLPGSPDLISAIEAHLTGCAYRSDHTSNAGHEQLLTVACSDFRQCIWTMTRVALDLHDPAHLVQNQQALIRIGCAARDARDKLQSLLSAQSQTYSGLSDQEAFWTGFTSNCLSGQQTDCGHWLYNLVLGCDWFEGHAEADVAAQLGIPWL